MKFCIYCVGIVSVFTEQLSITLSDINKEISQHCLWNYSKVIFNELKNIFLKFSLSYKNDIN